MRKQNSNAACLTKLSPEQRATVNQWLTRDGVGYIEVAQRIKEQFGVTISKSSLWRHYHATDAERIREKILGSSVLANEIIDEVEASPTDSFKALTEVLTRFALLDVQGENADMATVVELAKAAIAGRKQITTESADSRATKELELKLKQYEEKVAAQKVAIEQGLQAARTGGLTPETLATIEQAAKLL